MMIARLSVAALLVWHVGSAAAQGLSCALPQKPMMEIELMFGRNIGGKLGVSETQWRTFLAREVSPRFPDGLTVFDTLGQWRDAKTKALVREQAKIVRVILAADAPSREKIDAIAAAYKQQFRQDAVGIVMRPACVSF